MNQSFEAAAGIKRIRGALPLWFVALLCVMLVYASPSMDGTRDPDYYWHILYANWMLEHRAIPAVDFISWPFEGQPYLLTQWLGQLLIGMAHAALGGPGTVALTLACIAGTVLVTWRAARQHCENSTLAFVIALLCTTLFWFICARPQMFSFLAMAGIVWLGEHARQRGWSWRQMAIGGAIMVAWVNLHGSYVVGLLYLGLLGTAQLMDVAPGPQAVAQKKGVAKAWSVALAICLLATLLNPHGWKAWVYVVEIAGLQSTTSGIINEWAPTSVGTMLGAWFILLLLGTVMAMAVSTQRPRPGDMWIVMMAGVFGLASTRQTYYASLVLVPLLARYGSHTSSAKLVVEGLKPHVPLWAGVLAICVSAATSFYLKDPRAATLDQWKRARYPVDGAKFINEHKLGGRVFNETIAGGYLAYATGLKVYIDGRMDLYKDKHFFEWFYVRLGTSLWKQKVEEIQADLYVLQNQSALTQLLMETGKFAMVHSDGHYAVIVPRSPRFQELIDRHQVKPPEFRIFDKSGRLAVELIGH